MDSNLANRSGVKQNPVMEPGLPLLRIFGWDGGIRTPECQDQNLVPYHLATSHHVKLYLILGSNPTRLTFGEPETSRLKTSFHRKISLQNATGISHPECQYQNLVPVRRWPHPIEFVILCVLTCLFYSILSLITTNRVQYKRMRVIQAPRKTKTHKPTKRTTWWIFATIILIPVIVGVYVLRTNNLNDVSASLVIAQSLQNNVTKKQNYTEQEFVKLLQSSRLPNTKPIVYTPQFTSNEQANSRIKQIIESRGFKLTNVPKADISNNNPGKEVVLQPLARRALNDLIDDAHKNNTPLIAIKGEVSVDESKSLFAEAIVNQGIQVQQIIDGSADNQILKIIGEVDPPGYSWLHTGYGVVFSCGNGVQDFQTTTCYKWLSTDNYANAKRFGWIPILVGTDQSMTKARLNQFYWLGANNL